MATQRAQEGGHSGFISLGRRGLGCTSVERDWMPRAVLWSGVVG
jgi:hypothetical protein